MSKLFVAPLICSSALLLLACGPNNTNSKAPENSVQHAQNTLNQTFQIDTFAQFDEPWAVVVLPDQRLLITERKGQLKLLDPKTKKNLNVQGIPTVSYGGQGGLGDVVLHPDFKNNHWIYLSYAVQGSGGYGAEISRAKLDLSNPEQPKLTDLKRIWQQVPKVSGQGHYAHRMLFGADGKLWVSSGERQKFDPAQDMKSNLGKILRLNEDGTPVSDSPFSQQGGVTAEIWSLGHRNPLGMAFDDQKQLSVS